MPASQISITIYNSAGRLVKRIMRESEPSVALQSLTWTYEMIDGVRTLDLTTELKAFIDSDLISDTQHHSLFCSYIKFAESQQERADFIVIFERCN